MILVHRLQGEPLFINADLIEVVEMAPDTIVTLVDGRKIIVAEGPDEIVARIRQFRAATLVAADELRSAPAAPPALAVVPRQDG